MDNLEHIMDGKDQEGGILKEILRTPLFKDILRDYLNNIDPKGGPVFVKTLVWEDPEVILSVMGALPAIINWVIGAISELAKQVGPAFPPQLLKSFIVNIGDDIDTDTLKDGLSAYGTLVKGVLDESPELGSALINAIKGPGVKAAGKGITSASRYINKIQREDPNLIGDIISGVISNIDEREFTKASMGLVNAVLDQKLPLVSWAWRLTSGRIRYKFRNKRNKMY